MASFILLRPGKYGISYVGVVQRVLLGPRFMSLYDMVSDGERLADLLSGSFSPERLRTT